MPVLDFAAALLESGRVKIAGAGAPRAEELAACDELLRVAADRAGLEMAGVAPEVPLPVARWGLERVYCGCQCLLYREIPAETDPLVVGLLKLGSERIITIREQKPRNGP
jgi:hypothetical protein